MLTSKILNQLAEKITDEVKGDWLVFGGASLYLIGLDSRATIDVEVAPFLSSTNEDLLNIMSLADRLNLPIETINQAGSFFLTRIQNWQNRCHLIKKGKKGRIFIPEFDLYIELKSARMSESDLLDCLNYFKWIKETKKSYAREEISQILTLAHSKANPDQQRRLLQLKKALS